MALMRSEIGDLRPIAPADAAACQRLSRAVSWPHRVADWEMAISLGQGVVAVHEGAIVASGMSWCYGESHAALGMIIVSPALQGGGIGRRLMRALFAIAGERALLLNATAAGEPLYRGLGFESRGVIHQHQGEAVAVASPALARGERLRPADSSDLPTLETHDRQATGLQRAPLLRELLARGDAVILERDGTPVGFSLLRRSGRGRVIGPVAAPDEAAARALIGHWLNGREGRFLRVDTPAGSGLGDWLAACGMPLAGTATGMVRGTPPAPAGPARLYGIVSQALG